MSTTARNLFTILIFFLSVCKANAQMAQPTIGSDGKSSISADVPALDDVNVFLLQSLAEQDENGVQICDSEVGGDSTFIYPNQLSLSGPAKTGDLIHFRTTDLNGIPVFSSEIFNQSSVTMLNLWSVTCSACISEMPELARLNREYKPKGGQVISLVYDAIEEDQIQEAKEILEDLGLTILTILPNDDIYRQLPTQFFPVTYFIDKEGKIIGAPIIGASPAIYDAHMSKYLKNNN